MELNSKAFLNSIEKFEKILLSITKKVDMYCKEELDKTGGSNFVLSIPDDIQKILHDYIVVLSESSDLTINNENVNKFNSLYTVLTKKYNDFNKLIDNIKLAPNGSKDNPGCMSDFSNYINELFFYITELYKQLKEKIELNKVLQLRVFYEEQIKEYSNLSDDLNDRIIQNTKKYNELILALEQKVNDKQVIDIKSFYNVEIKGIKKDRNVNCFFYYLLSGAFISLLVALVVMFNKEIIKSNNLMNYIFSTGVISFLGFIINDFRKRFNIAKNILDEYRQKSVVVDTYSSLLTRITKFDDETKKMYNEAILKNIIGTLLDIKNHGYLGKSFNSSSPNITAQMLQCLIDKEK